MGFRTPLGLCPKCGMDSGRRKMLDHSDKPYMVWCETCLYHTRRYNTPTKAVDEWNHPAKYGR